MEQRHTQSGLRAISYRLAYMGSDEVPNPCGPYFESMTAAQQAAPELNATRATRGQKPLDCIIRFRYRAHPGRYGQKRKVLTILSLDGWVISDKEDARSYASE